MLNKFDSNGLQFARLLSEIVKVGVDDKMLNDLSDSMDLSVGEIGVLFGRAISVFDSATHNPSKVSEIGAVPVLLPDGSILQLALLCETGTQNVFAVDASYVEQDNYVESPFGNGLLEWLDAPEMKSKGDYSHTVVNLHVLSDDPAFNPGEWSVADLAREGDSGDVVTMAAVSQQVWTTPAEMAELLCDFGSDPEFFDIDDELILANDSRCVVCRESDDVEYDSRDNGRQAAKCHSCGSEWFENSDSTDTKEQPVVMSVDIIKEGKINLKTS